MVLHKNSMNLQGTSFPLADANGNCVSFIDNAGNVQAHYTYDAFGNTVSQTGAMAADFRFRFSSKYLDDETGLYYYGYRYYAPALGRWLNRDPISDIAMNICPDSVQYFTERYVSSPSLMANLFQFNENAPVLLVDILGLLSFDYFTIKLKPDMDTPYYQSAAAGAPLIRDGFEIDYWPADDCPCDNDEIRLVQTKKLGSGDPVIDVYSDRLKTKHKNTPGGIPLPGYIEGGGPRGDADSPFAYWDAPYSPISYGLFDHALKWTFEICAICKKDDKDKILGCMKFVFSTAGDGSDGKIYGDCIIVGVPPTAMWEKAVEAWKKEAGEQKK